MALSIAGAVVVEEGGLLSHAAVIARELGLPAIIGAAGAMDAIPDGAVVEVDPVAGRVRVLAGGTGSAMTAQRSVANAHAWFEQNSGWAPPDRETLAELASEGLCRAPDECLVTPDGWCEHGLASWQLILDALD